MFDASPIVAHSCIVGNYFIAAPAEFLCLIIELSLAGATDSVASAREITKILATVNRTLPAPLRIAWSRVLILPAGQRIPFSRKGVILRKKLEQSFSAQISTLLGSTKFDPGPDILGSAPAIIRPALADSSWTEDTVATVLLDTLCSVLEIGKNLFEANLGSTFAEVKQSSLH